jgi:hypothetical protein
MSTDSAFSTIAYPLSFNKLKYIDLTNQLNNYNEIYNMNQYVSNINKSELDKIVSFNENLKTKILKLKQEYLLKDFAMYNYIFWSNIMYFTIIITGIVLAIIAITDIPFLSKNVKIIIMSVIGFLYLLVLMILLGVKLMRRKYSWNQFYWKKQ